MKKPEVIYRELLWPASLQELEPGMKCLVTPINHPRCSNRKPVYTSRVVEVNEDGFETENTIYQQAKEPTL